MKGWLFLDIIITEGTAIFQLLACEDQPLLVRRDAFLVLDLGLDVLDGITGFNFKGDGLACQGLYKNLHTSSESQH